MVHAAGHRVGAEEAAERSAWPVLVGLAMALVLVGPTLSRLVLLAGAGLLALLVLLLRATRPSPGLKPVHLCAVLYWCFVDAMRTGIYVTLYLRLLPGS